MLLLCKDRKGAALVLSVLLRYILYILALIVSSAVLRVNNDRTPAPRLFDFFTYLPILQARCRAKVCACYRVFLAARISVILLSRIPLPV